MPHIPITELERFGMCEMNFHSSHGMTLSPRNYSLPRGGPTPNQFYLPFIGHASYRPGADAFHTPRQMSSGADSSHHFNSNEPLPYQQASPRHGPNSHPEDCNLPFLTDMEMEPFEFHNCDNGPPPSVKDTIVCVNRHDVLCGRGGGLRSAHFGNQYFRRMIQSHCEMYRYARRCEKHLIALFIIDTIRSHGGRFLRRCQSTNGKGWRWIYLELGNARTYETTCRALRAPVVHTQGSVKQAFKKEDVFGDSNEAT